MQKFVEMGKFYRNSAGTLIKTVCRGINTTNKQNMVAFAYVGKGGCVSDINFMPEDEFISTFLS